MEVAVIGGADGPTSIFIATQVGGISWIHMGGLLLVILLLVPNIIYGIKNRGKVVKGSNKIIEVVEQIGRYVCIGLMVFNITGNALSFGSVRALYFYGIGNIVLILAYWVAWCVYWKRPSWVVKILLAVLPVGVFVLRAITLGDIALLIAAIVFGVCHVKITYDQDQLQRR